MRRRKWPVAAFAKLNRAFRPGTVLRLTKLWPHARQHGYEHGQVLLVGAYCDCCGPNLIYLFTVEGELNTTGTRDFVRAHFAVVAPSNTRRWFTFPEPWPPASVRTRVA